MEMLPLVRVFVVDDERIIAQTLGAILEKNGFSSRSFNDPLEALAAAHSSDTPDLLISDVMMPQLSGIDLAIQIRALHPLCRIVLFSGQAETTDLLETAHAQGHTFQLLAKPLHPLRLLHELRNQEPAEPGEAEPPA